MEKKEKDFGLPVVDNTPTGHIQMMGNFYRGLTRHKRSTGMRALIIIFGLFFLLLPGAALLVVAAYLLLNPFDEIIYFYYLLYSILFGSIFFYGGVHAIRTNVKKRDVQDKK